MNKLTVIVVLLFLSFGTFRIARATGPICHPPVCGKTCSPQARMVEDEQPCYRIERREICIPEVTFPWQKCCGPPKCGRVICVNKLEQDTRTVRKCEYTWPIRSTCLPCSSGPTPPSAPPTR